MNLFDDERLFYDLGTEEIPLLSEVFDVCSYREAGLEEPLPPQHGFSNIPEQVAYWSDSEDSRYTD